MGICDLYGGMTTLTLNEASVLTMERGSRVTVM